MTHLDLFSGIGGFALAADRVFGDVEHIFCDTEPFAQQVLKKHWPEAYIYDDIRLITDTNSEGLQGQNASRTPGQPWAGECVDLLTGGFPCQPFSAAGLRRGTADDRYLWPEMLRVIRLMQPTWIIAENVRGLVTWNEGLVLQQVCTDLEASSYEVQPLIIPAVAVNAPHRRDRIWFVAHRNQQRSLEGRAEIQPTERHEAQPGSTFGDKALASPGRLRRGTGGGEALQPEGQEPERENSIFASQGYSWSSDWSEVAAELCGVDDGLPVRLGGFELSKPQHRAAQLKAYGNAIVPQVAMQIMHSIKEAYYV